MNMRKNENKFERAMACRCSSVIIQICFASSWPMAPFSSLAWYINQGQITNCILAAVSLLVHVICQ